MSEQLIYIASRDCGCISGIAFEWTDDIRDWIDAGLSVRGITEAQYTAMQPQFRYSTTCDHRSNQTQPASAGAPDRSALSPRWLLWRCGEMPEQLYDVVAVSIINTDPARPYKTVRLIESGKDWHNADAIETMAIARRGLAKEFFAIVPHGAYRSGEEWTGDRMPTSPAAPEVAR